MCYGKTWSPTTLHRMCNPLTLSFEVRLWYAHQDYSLRLGQLVTIWAVHVSNGIQGSYSSAAAPLFVSIFPERDRTCHLMTHENSDDGVICTTPLNYHEGKALSGLMTMRSFIDGGYELSDCKILVCVKSIGAKKRGKHTSDAPVQ